MGKTIRRTPKGYDGPGVTTHKVSEILSVVLSRIGENYQNRPDLILITWPEIIGQRFAEMTRAVSFIDGVLTVKVMNSTLHSLLNQNEKPRLLNMLRKKFPQTLIKTIVFRIG